LPTAQSRAVGRSHRELEAAEPWRHERGVAVFEKFRRKGPLPAVGETRCMPKRLQRSRQAGARLPAGTVVVTRPTKWGNPHPLNLGRAEAVRRYRHDLLTGQLAVTVEEVRQELARRDLACYCPLDAPCHADVLIEIANESATGMMD
jgi:Domain of unknown function (DUF4326)